MDPESKELLKNTFVLIEENNKLLYKIRSVQKRETFWQLLKIFVIVGIAFGSFYFLEPYLEKMMDLYGSISGAEENVKNISDPSFIQDLLKKL